MARRHGYAGQVKLDSVTVASIDKWNLQIQHNDAPVTAFNDANVRYVRGLPDYKGSIAGTYDFRGPSPAEGNAALFDAIEGMDEVDLQLIPVSTEAANYWGGPSLLDGNVDVDVNGKVSIGAQFKPSGDWQRAGL
jgi:hypothetical protein